MEHLLVHIVLETIYALDRKLQRPLGKVIPDYPAFQADPPKYLSQNAITFGPRRRHVLAIVIGLASAAGVTLLLFLAFRNMPRPQPQDELLRWIGVIVSFLVVALVARTVALRLMPGGSMTLTRHGAALVYGELTLFLPWDVLQASGGVFEPDHKLVVLPINPNIPIAITNPEGDVKAVLPTELELPQAESSDSNQIALKDLYEVRIGEVGELLRDLGLRLGTVDAGADVVLTTMVAPLAVPDDKGWLRIQLTQLPFPPYCAGCGQPTTDELNILMRAAANRSFTLPVPFCKPCSNERRRQRWIWASIGFGLGMFTGITLAAILSNGIGDLLFAVLAILLGFGLSIPLAMLFQFYPLHRHTPVRCREYKPDKGTLKMKFRNPVPAEPLLAAMGISLASLAQKPNLQKVGPDAVVDPFRAA